MTSKRREGRLMKCTTVLHGGECHYTSIPNKNGNTMKEKKKKKKKKKKCVCVQETSRAFNVL